MASEVKYTEQLGRYGRKEEQEQKLQKQLESGELVYVPYEATLTETDSRTGKTKVVRREFKQQFAQPSELGEARELKIIKPEVLKEEAFPITGTVTKAPVTFAPSLLWRAEEYVKDVPGKIKEFGEKYYPSQYEKEIALQSQERGTQFYEGEEFYTPTTKVQVDRSEMPSLFGSVISAAETITPIPILVPKDAWTYDEGTGMWRQWKDIYPDKKFITLKRVKKDVVQYFKDLSREEQDKRYKAVSNVANAKYGTDFQNLVYNQNKEKYDAGEITWDEAVKKTEKSPEWKKLLKEYEDFFSGKLEEYTKEYKGYKENLFGFSEMFVGAVPSSGLTIGATVAAAGVVSPTKVVPYIFSSPITKVSGDILEANPLGGNVVGQFGGGATLGFIGGSTLGVAYGTEFAKGLVSDPFGTVAGAVEYGIEKPGELAGFLVGGYARTKVGKIVEVGKVSEAIKQLEVKTKPLKGLARETMVNAMNLSPEVKAEVIKILREGGSVKVYDIKGIAKKGFEKYTPDIRGRFLEAYNIQGDLINRYGTGGIKITYKGKPIDIQLANQAVAMIEQSTGRIQGLSDVVTRQFKGKKITKEERLRFLEDSEILLDIEGYLKKGDITTKRRIVISKSQANLLSKSKYLGEDLLKEYKTKGLIKVIPDFEYLKKGAKPYLESTSGEIRRPLSFKYGEAQVGDIGLFGGETKFGITGEAISRRVREPKIKPKPSKAIPGFKDLYGKPPTEVSPTEAQFISVIKEIPGDIKGIFDRFKKEPPVKKVAKQVQAQKYPTLVGGTGAESIFTGKQFKVPSGTAEAVQAGISGVEAGSLVGSGFNLGGLIGGFGESIGKDFTRDKQFSATLTDQQLQPTIVSDFSSVLVREKETIKPSERFGNLIAPVEFTREKIKPSERLLQPQRIAQAQITRQVQRPRVPQITQPAITPTPIPIPVTPTIVFPFMFPGEKRKEERRIGYNVEVKEKGKWKKVNDRPFTRQGAMDVGSRITDNSLSASFRINPIMQTKKVKGRKLREPKVFEERLEQGDGYFNVVANKFRDFVQRKGKRIKTKDRWVERKGFRSDTVGESQGLTVAQIRGRQTRISLGLPTRRTKSKGKQRFRL